MGTFKQRAKARTRQHAAETAAERRDGPALTLIGSPDQRESLATNRDASFNIALNVDVRHLPRVSADEARLSVRAENVLKELAVVLVGENPPQGRWISDLLVQRLTYYHLSTARNCGPQTRTEIIKWAKTQGKLIQRSSYAGKSLSSMWEDTIAKFSAGKISRAEVVEALEKSARRRNTRVPVAFQEMLLQLVNSQNEH